MRFQLFQYPLPAPPDLADLNAYLDKHRVSAVTHHLAETPGGSLLLFVVQSAEPAPRGGRGEARIDYRAVPDRSPLSR